MAGRGHGLEDQALLQSPRVSRPKDHGVTHSTITSQLDYRLPTRKRNLTRLPYPRMTLMTH